MGLGQLIVKPIQSEMLPYGWMEDLEILLINGVILRLGPSVTKITHTGLNPSMQSGQMYHIAKFERERFDQIDKVLRCKDWIFHKMTGEILTEISEAIMTLGLTSYKKI
jgi:sugar (pentulose or hexulose) kinase